MFVQELEGGRGVLELVTFVELRHRNGIPRVLAAINIATVREHERSIVHRC